MRVHVVLLRISSYFCETCSSSTYELSFFLYLTRGRLDASFRPRDGIVFFQIGPDELECSRSSTPLVEEYLPDAKLAQIGHLGY